jgi:hypothetical protein
MNEEALKYDEDKLRYDLLPVYALREVVRVYTIGAKKYADNNWRKGTRWSRIIGALMRHFEAWRQGEKYDRENGQHHLASVVWCALTLMEWEMDETGEDDRYEVTGGGTTSG